MDTEHSHTQESSQLPEEAPPEQVFEDERSGRNTRQEAEHTPGVPGETGRATGENPQPGSAASYGDLLSRIGDRTSLDKGGAEQALSATLSALAERISAGEAADLATLLPQPAQNFLQAEKGYGTSSAEAFHVVEFIRRVAEREGQPTAQAEVHARAVFQSLREALPTREFDDAMAQLPDDFETVTVPWRA